MAADATDGATERADRILDAAAELLVRLGYRKVTVEDVANLAGIGKGTVYLHWRTKAQLFEALILRESVGFMEELAAELRADPTAVLPHRLLTLSFLIVARRPVFRALTVAQAPQIRSRGFDPQERQVVERLLDLLEQHGLFRAGIPSRAYTVNACTMGFYLLDDVDPAAAGLDLQQKADALAYTLRHAFEPAEQPDRETLAVAAEQAVALSEELIAPYRARIYTYDRKLRTP